MDKEETDSLVTAPGGAGLRYDELVDTDDEVHPTTINPTPTSSSPPPQTAGTAPSGGSLRGAFAFADAKDKYLLLLAIVCCIVQGAAPPLNMFVLGDSINRMGVGDIDDAIRSIVRNFGIIGAISFVLGMIGHTLFEVCAERQSAALKRAYVHGVMRQEIAFYDTKDPGSIATDIEQSTIRFRDAVGIKFALVWQLGSQFVVGYIVALLRSWRLSLVMTSVIPIIFVGTSVIGVKLRLAAKKADEIYAEAGSIAEEAVPAMRTIAAFGLEGLFIDKFNAKVNLSEAQDRKNNLARSVLGGCIFMVLFLSYALGWWYGNKLVVDRLIETQGQDHSMGGKVMTVFFSIMVASFSMGQIAPNLSALSQAAGSVSAVLELIGRSSAVDPFATEGKEPSTVVGSIEFDNVHFCYPTRTERKVYDGVTFNIAAGETVALVGASGCGKSTAVQLIERFYDVTGGSIKFDGTDIRELNIQWLRAQIAIVSQEPKLFSSSISDNIRCGAKDPTTVTDREIIEAARSANAHEFISAFAAGYDTEVGQAGSLLSGGQKQRIAIARAILRDPSILILDEATSALDNESEKIVQKALDELIRMKRRTTIIIAHRLTTIRGADKIIVFANPDGHGAKIAEFGTHDQLMNVEEGIYRALVEAQQLSGSDDLEGDIATAARGLGNAAGAALTVPSRSPSEVPISVKALSRSPSNRSLPHDDVVAHSRKAHTPYRGGKTHRLWRYTTSDWPYALIGAIGAAADGALFPVLMIVITSFLAVFFSPTDDFDSMRQAGSDRSLILVGLGISAGLASFLAQYGWGTVGERLVANMRRNVFNSLMYQDMEYFDDPENTTGHISAVLSGDCALTRGMTGENLSLMLQNLSTLVIALVVAFMGRVSLALVAMASYSLMIPAFYIQLKSTRHVRPQAHDLQDSLFDKSTTHFVLNEIATNLRTIAAYNMQSYMKGIYATALSKEFSRASRNALVTGLSSGFATAIMAFANGVSYWYAARLIKSDPTLKLETVMRTVLVLMIAVQGIGRATAFATDAKKAKAACHNMFYILDRQPAIDARDFGDGDRSTPITGNIRLQDVIFRYPGRPEQPVLNNVSFTVQPGQAIALVGASGCGKSTIVQLLQRFYDVGPSDNCRLMMEPGQALLPHTCVGGEIRVEDKDIRSFNVKYLRSRMGLVSQEPVLFTGTIRENIRHGKLDATDEEIRQAARMANAAEFIEQLPETYDTQVGRGGTQMSGGQKQRIAIARALIRDPDIMLFDEATSALDPESEAIVQKTLNALVTGRGQDGTTRGKKKTSITIAHRLSTIKDSDKIVVFEPHPIDGSTVVEEGKHDDLMRRPNGVYRKLVEIGMSGSNA